MRSKVIKRINLYKDLQILFVVIFLSACSSIGGKSIDSETKHSAIERYFNNIYMISSCEWPLNRLIVIDFCLKFRPYFDSSLQKVELHFIPVKENTFTYTNELEAKKVLLKEFKKLQDELGLPNEDSGLLVQTPVFLSADYLELDKSIFQEILFVLNVKLEINGSGVSGIIEKSNSSGHIYTINNHGISIH